MTHISLPYDWMEIFLSKQQADDVGFFIQCANNLELYALELYAPFPFLSFLTYLNSTRLFLFAFLFIFHSLDMAEITDSDIEAVEGLLLSQSAEEVDDVHAFAGATSWKEHVPHSIPDFVGQTGLQRDIGDEDILSPLFLLTLFVTEDMLSKVVLETNVYAANIISTTPHENPREWYYLTPREFQTWLGLAVFNSLHPYPRLSNYWSTHFAFEMRQVPATMSLRRFEQIKRFLHLSSLDPSTDCLAKFRPWTDELVSNCKSVYYPGREISIDEMVIPFQGRCRFKSRIKYKRAGDGFLVYALCDSSNGYTFTFQFAFDTTVEKIEMREGKLANAVYNLVRQLQEKWHVIVTDNLYTSVRLAEYLLQHEQLFLGTCRANRGFPASIFMKKAKSRDEQKRSKGALKYKSRNGVLAVAYYDNSPVHFISTAHSLVTMVDIHKDIFVKDGQGKYKKEVKIIKRPNVNHDYNNWMDGVDVSDQLRLNYDSKLKSNKYWHSVFWWAFDAAITNAYIIHREECQNRGLTQMKHLAFRAKLVEQLIGGHLRCSTVASTSNSKRAIASAAVKQPSAVRLVGMHLIRRVQGAKAKHKAERDCVQCKKAGVGRKRTVYECGTCNIGLHPDCFEQYHTAG